MCAAALFFVLVGATAASAAKNICVGNDTTGACPSGSFAATDMLDAASKATDPSLNSVYVTSGTYSNSTGANFVGKPVKIYGVGPTRPILSINSAPSYPADTAVLTTGDSNTVIDNIQVDLPVSSGLTGILSDLGGQLLSNITINGPAADSSNGIIVGGSNPRVRNAAINVGSGNSNGVFVDGSGSAILDDISVTHATTAVVLDTAENFKLRRLNSRAKNGVATTASNGTISSSLIRASAAGAENSGGKGVSASTTSGTSNDVRVDNCTLISGGESGTIGVAASASGAASVQSILVNSSIVSGFETAAGTSALSSGVASIDLAYSRYSGALQGSTTLAGGTQQTGDYGFVNAAGGNYNLALTSPLVDAGDPTQPNTNDSATDANDQPRVVSRGSGNIRDIGAYEVQNSAPVPKIQIVTAVPSTTSSTQFSAAGSTDAEGDAVTYTWKFDGAPGPSGITAQKMFILDGPHSVQLTVTDKTGSSTSATVQFNVARGFLAIKLRSQNTTISKQGTFKITMSCPADAISNCSGRLLFQTTKKVNAKNYTERPAWTAAKPAYLQAARYVFSIAPGTTQKLEVRTYSTFQNVLGVHKKFKIQSNLVSGTTGNASLTANRATFTVRAPKKK